MTQPKSVPRDGTIDSFRAIAILSVIGFHYLTRFSPPFFPVNLYGYDGAMPTVFEVGRLGVEVFFVISGYIIAMTIGRFDNSFDFVARRIARLFPAFLVGCTITFLCVTAFGPDERRVGLADFVANLTMVPTDLGFDPVDGAYWSLAVELKFYFYIALTYLLLRSRYWLGILAICLLGVVTMLTVHKGATAVLLAQFMPYFVIGIALWKLKSGHRAEALLCLAVAAISFVAIDCLKIEQGQYQIVGFAYLTVVLGALYALVLGGINITFAPLLFIGRISYSLYIVHQNLGLILIRWLSGIGLPHPLAATIALALGCALAYLMFRYVEGPGQVLVLRLYENLKSRILPAQARRPAASS